MVRRLKFPRSPTPLPFLHHTSTSKSTRHIRNYAALPHTKPIPNFFPGDLKPLHTTTEPQMFDELPQRAALHFHPLHLLKTGRPSPELVGCVHCSSRKTGSLTDVRTRTAIITGYAKVGIVDSSLALFDEAPARDAVLWNAVIHAFVRNHDFQTAVALFREMVRGFGKFDSVTFLIILSVLSRVRSLEQGAALQGTIIKRGLDSDNPLCNSLVDMYAKCGDLCSSISVFDRMEFKDVVSWNSMITGCLRCGFPETSALYFRDMQLFDVERDHVSLSSVISACSCLEELYDFGKSVHGCVIKLGCEVYSSVANSLISFHSCCGDMPAAEKVFGNLVDKNVVSCNAVINMLVENKRVSEAFDLLHVMQFTLTVEPDPTTVVTILPLCTEFGLLREGKAVHGFAIRKGLETLDASITNSLIDMYGKCDDLGAARILFNAMPNRDLISWNTIISGYSRCLKEKSRDLFRELLQTGQKCSLATLLVILPSCDSKDDLQYGELIHCWMLKYGFSSSILAINSLMLMYIDCGNLLASLLLLNAIIAVSDVISWNTVIVGCSRNGYCKDALEIFKLMQQSSDSNPDPITLVNVLSACGNLALSFHGKGVHGFALKSLMESDVRVRNALISMYFRCGDVESAESLFKTDSGWNLCSWNCMISGLVQNNEAEKAWTYFRRMETFQPSEITVVSIMCACTQLEDVEHGRQINGYVYRFGIHTNVFISAALVDMYSKCGRLDIAIRVFRQLEEKSLASWNSMIFAYGYHGYGRKAIELFSKMCELGIKPTKSTFIGILSACSHSGLIDDGLEIYDRMSAEFGIEPTTEHHVCVVDMLGRAGRLNEAYTFVRNVHTKPAPSVWGALLSACKDHGDPEMGKSIAEYLFSLQPENEGYYVTLSNLYASTGRWSDAIDIRSMIQDRGLIKPPGCSYIEVCTV